MSSQLTEQEILRRQKLDELIKLGINPYPADLWKTDFASTYILDEFDNEPEGFKEISFAGRIMSIRDMGKASFAVLQDASGKIQIYVKRDDVCPGEDKTMYDIVWKKLLDIGDIIGVKGFVFRTKMGEISIHVKEFKLLTKSLRPLPMVKEDAEGKIHDAFTDPEMRYRQRYVDLIVNPQVREVFRKRIRLVNTMRNYLDDKGYLEVETPILQPLYGGAAARPFKTHHNTLDMTLYLRIANELYLKRLIVGGFDGVYEFSKDFRNEGMDRTHNPEFTQVELYVAYKDYEWMMNLVEEMIEKVAMDLHGTTEVKVGDNTINFKRPWKRFTMYEAIQHFTGVDISEMDETAMRNAAKEMGVELDQTMGRGKIIDTIFGEKCEANLIQPTFITDYPVEMSPLAKKHRSKPGLVERFEAICNSKEICNAFSELNDPIDQRKRFEEQLTLGLRGDEEAMQLDEDFLRAIEYGMPPTAGLGIGIDRLTMIMTNSPSIQDVLFFPQMRAETIETSVIKDTGLSHIPSPWNDVIAKMGVTNVEQLKNMNPNKLFNDLGGMRKKMKLDVAMVSLDDVKSWMGGKIINLMVMQTKNWAEAIQPLLKKYNKKQHPLEYKSRYQLVVMVILSAQDSDRNINNIAPALFNAFPDMESLSRATPDALFPFISKVRNFGNKTKWLIEMAQKIKSDKNIPISMEELTALPGIGRKSANVIRREAGEKPEGVIVDLHVVRVAPRIGIASGTDPKKIEKQIMEALPQKDWDAGMCMSFLGREICRPTNPKHQECVVNTVCEYYKAIKKK